MTMKESLRLYPPAWLLGGRVALQECEIGGFRMPAGAMIVICPWVTHRDPRNFENPELFKPERWVADRATMLPKYAYYPCANQRYSATFGKKLPRILGIY